jgi:hypothetical protein
MIKRNDIVRSEVITPAALAVASVAAFFHATSFPAEARIFPFALSAILFAICALRVVRSLGIEEPVVEFALEGPVLKRFFFVLGASTGLVVALMLLGMFPAIFVFLMVMFSVLAGLGLARYAGLSLAVTISLYVMFDLVLELPSPEGYLVEILLP